MAEAASTTPPTESDAAEGPWYRQVNRDQWRAFWAVFLGWVVDSFDFNILTFIVIDRSSKSALVVVALSSRITTTVRVSSPAGMFAAEI